LNPNHPGAAALDAYASGRVKNDSDVSQKYTTDGWYSTQWSAANAKKTPLTLGLTGVPVNISGKDAVDAHQDALNRYINNPTDKTLIDLKNSAGTYQQAFIEYFDKPIANNPEFKDLPLTKIALELGKNVKDLTLKDLTIGQLEIIDKSETKIPYEDLSKAIELSGFSQTTGEINWDGVEKILETMPNSKNSGKNYDFANTWFMNVGRQITSTPGAGVGTQVNFSRNPKNLLATKLLNGTSPNESVMFEVMPKTFGNFYRENYTDKQIPSAQITTMYTQSPESKGKADEFNTMLRMNKATLNSLQLATPWNEKGAGVNVSEAISEKMYKDGATFTYLPALIGDKPGVMIQVQY